MTEQEALDYFIRRKEQLGISDKIQQAETLAISALEKQIPRVAKTQTINRGMDQTGEYQIDSYYICPCCKAVVGDYECDEIYDYCPKCGQALKGEKIKDD